MSDLEKYVEKLKGLYGDEVLAKPSHYKEEQLLAVPKPLREFYSVYDSLETPFGSIDSIETAAEHSYKAEPFKSEGAFCFGADDNAFCFWLCAMESDKEEDCFGEWDHDFGGDIEYEFNDLIEFLECIREVAHEDMEEEF